ncbi:hypothetical protein [Allorhodopirellula heiligendammensis]|uniref:Uncharacterized protein n=1 Tax=Allorhodopirellula heiligendammensis TaxID=2714739 RepID=A0A5C6C5A1_9BACT|nr:hypothetical protein [Allorhodopirellula heiligendammensis]TWU17979.1 hypothetical protein Poly21_01320 [Allorhodopirellula heiligendammensis]
MRDLLTILAACVLCTFLIVSTGCTDNPNCNTTCPTGQCCPNCTGCPGFDCPGGQCPGGYGPGNPCCPGGQCPRPVYPNGSLEIGDVDNADVNQEALRQTKDADCASCPNYRPNYSCPTCPNYQPQPQVVIGPSRIVQPAPVAKPAAIIPPVRPATKIVNSDLREGVFRCARCSKSVVGKDWHELWADDNTPMTCLCEQCWQVASAGEKRSYLTSYLEKSGLSKSQNFYCSQLISAVR